MSNESKLPKVYFKCYDLNHFIEQLDSYSNNTVFAIIINALTICKKYTSRQKASMGDPSPICFDMLPNYSFCHLYI